MNKPGKEAFLQGQPAVVIHKRGALSTLFAGIFATLCVALVCGSAVAMYALTLVNSRVHDLVTASPELLTEVRQWQEALPPVMSDALQDRRAPEYRNQVQAEVRMVGERYSNHSRRPILEITNEGEELITMLTLRVTIEDEAGLPVREETVYAATPLAVESQWRGPLMPNSTRRISLPKLYDDSLDEFHASAEIVEIRVWDEAANRASIVQGDATAHRTDSVHAANSDEFRPASDEPPTSLPSPEVSSGGANAPATSTRDAAPAEVSHSATPSP